MSFGADVGRHLGFEIAGDVFETNLKRRGRDIGEYGVFTLIPQIRLRAALPGTPMTPYLLAGAGVSLNEFNDRKKPAVGLSVRADDVAVVGTVGTGLDYTLTDDIAIGAELRYLVSRGHEIEIAGRRRDAQLAALLATASLRLLFSGQHSVESLGAPDVDTAGRYYLALRIGGATITDRRIGGPIEATPENAAKGDFSLLLGVGVGVDVGSHLGVELVADGHEPILKVRGVGAVGEYAVYTVVPQIRFRYPMLGGRFVPYLLGGVGVSYAEFNDRKPHGLTARVHGTDYGVALATGVGLEYFITNNIALGLETRYHTSRAHQLLLADRTHNVHVDAVLITAGVRIYLGSLWARVAR